MYKARFFHEHPQIVRFYSYYVSIVWSRLEDNVPLSRRSILWRRWNYHIDPWFALNDLLLSWWASGIDHTSFWSLQRFLSIFRILIELFVNKLFTTVAEFDYARLLKVRSYDLDTLLYMLLNSPALRKLTSAGARSVRVTYVNVLYIIIWCKYLWVTCKLKTSI